MESRGGRQRTGPVLVGVTGSGENRGALFFAADEARRLDQPVRLVMQSTTSCRRHPGASW